MWERHNPTVYELLKETGAVSALELDALHQEVCESGKSLARCLIDRGWMESDVLLAEIANALGWDCVRELPEKIDPALAALVSSTQARSYGIVPWRNDQRGIDLLTTDPFDSRAVDDLTFVLGREIRLVVGDAE